MVAVTTEARLLVAHLLQMSPCRFRPTLLQGAFELEQPSQGRLPAPLPQELIVGRDGRARQTKIDTDHLIGRFNARRGDGDNHMQPSAPVTLDEISSVIG